MNTLDDQPKKSPSDRFRNIVSGEPSKDQTPAGHIYPKNTASPILNLPKAKPKEGNAPAGSNHPALAPSPTIPTAVYRPKSNRFLPAFWTAASIISLVVNAVLLIVVVSLVRNFGNLNAASIGSGVLGGLYGNFERMDSAHIKTAIPLQTNIPLDLQVPVQTTTAITLAQDTRIPGAHVKITTALFNIDAPANVTLPAGTTMNVALNFMLPVQAQVPVNLNVPVDIAVRDTELHPAILGLQDTLRPLYCMMSPSAQTLTGDPVCK